MRAEHPFKHTSTVLQGRITHHPAHPDNPEPLCQLHALTASQRHWQKHAYESLKGICSGGRAGAQNKTSTPETPIKL